MRSEEDRDEESIDSMYSLHEQLPPVRKGQWARYFPFGFWYEWRHLAMLAIPIMLTSMSNYAMVPVSLFFLGRMGKTELAAGGLAISIFHVAGLSIIFGLFTASETLFSQTFGGSNKFRLGVQVRRGLLTEYYMMYSSTSAYPCKSAYLKQ
ncbi:Multidrug and toxin extrusion protein 1 [Echinococcus granulosus]|nr:Multidrug and toxin extrusion protein 1 [Echinococcus granulosus]